MAVDDVALDETQIFTVDELFEKAETKLAGSARALAILQAPETLAPGRRDEVVWALRQVLTTREADEFEAVAMLVDKDARREGRITSSARIDLLVQLINRARKEARKYVESLPGYIETLRQQRTKTI